MGRWFDALAALSHAARIANAAPGANRFIHRFSQMDTDGSSFEPLRRYRMGRLLH